MRGVHARARIKNFDVPRGQVSEDFAGDVADQAGVSAVDAFEVPEQQRELLEVQGGEFFVDAVKRVGEGMSDVFRSQEGLHFVNVFAGVVDLAVLGLGDSPDEKVDTAFVLGKIDGDFFADDHAGQVRDLEAPFDRVLVGEGHEVHSPRFEEIVGLQRVGVARGEIQPPQHPVGRTVAVAGMNMEVGAGFRGIHCAARMRDSQPS